MKDSNKQYLYSVLRQAWQELRVMGTKAGQVLMRTPLPRVLMLCIGLALLITLIPLILTLFVIFMLVKLLLLVVMINVRKNKVSNVHAEQSQRSWSYKDMDDVEDAQLVRVEQINYRRKDQ
jgi:ABC-type transport system involved in cytochrome bd biosynthesis fused ATPase/permease subunit